VAIATFLELHQVARLLWDQAINEIGDKLMEIGAKSGPARPRERGSRNDRKIGATKAIDAKTLCCAMWFCADGRHQRAA
jgi:hypothetical protein